LCAESRVFSQKGGFSAKIIKFASGIWQKVTYGKKCTFCAGISERRSAVQAHLRGVGVAGGRTAYRGAKAGTSAKAQPLLDGIMSISALTSRTKYHEA